MKPGEVLNYLVAALLITSHLSLDLGPSGRMSFKASMITTPRRRIIAGAIWGFEIRRFAIHSMIDPSDVDKFFLVAVPLWPFILLLLIVPVRWLIAHPANALAFPVIRHE